MMDFKRAFLYAAFFMVTFMLWGEWQKEHPESAVNNAASTINQKQSYLPSQMTLENGRQPENASDLPVPKTTFQEDKQITIDTDVLKVAIDLKQGTIVSAALKQYPESLENKKSPFMLLNDDKSSLYVAKSSLFVKNNNDFKNIAVAYQTDKAHYVMSSHQDSLNVTLSGVTEGGLKVNKIFSFKRGSYLVEQQYALSNQSDETWTGYLNLQLLRSHPQEDKRSLFNVGSYVGASMSNPDGKIYKKVSLPDIKKDDVNQNIKNGWVAMQQHYFLSAWIPSTGTTNQFYTRYVNEDYVIGLVSEPMTIKPNGSLNRTSKLYVGPEVTDTLSKIAPGLDLTVDYGWLWFISKFLFFLLDKIHSIVGNWGWSIVLVTVLIKACFYRLSAKSYRSMASMRRLQPQIERLRERFADDKQKLTQETMALYRKEKVNPLGGCLPILIQIPVFIGLYWVLLESVQLRQAPFIFWIQDLAAKDPFFILPILMGLSMFLQQKMNPPPPDPTQAKVMSFLPIFFTFLFLNFPSGLVLYWVVNNSLSILQQWYITEKYGKEVKKKATLSANEAFSK